MIKHTPIDNTTFDESVKLSNNMKYYPKKAIKCGRFFFTPQIAYRKKNKYNSTNFTFNWLILNIWTLDHFDFEVAINIGTHWGIGITMVLPYLRIVCCVPCPFFIERWVNKYLYRAPKIY